MESLSEIIQSIPRESFPLVVKGGIALVALAVLAIVAVLALRHDSSETPEICIEVGRTTSSPPPSPPPLSVKFPDFELKGERLVQVQSIDGKSHLLYCRAATVSALREGSLATEEEKFAWAGSAADGMMLMSYYKYASDAFGWVEVHKWYRKITGLSELCNIDISEVEVDVKIDISSPMPIPVTLNEVPVVIVTR